MTRMIGKLALSATLVAAALWCRGEATRVDATADLWRQLATLDNDLAPSPPPSRLWQWVPAGLGAGGGEASRQRATADYWLKRYDDLVRTRGGDPDPEVLQLAANAAYRAASQSGVTGAEAARQLDPVLAAYGSVLKVEPSYADAAWNFEFVSRARDAVAQSRAAGRGRAAAATPGVEPPPAGASVHGVPGAAPPEAKGEEFETLAPMDYSDREAQPEATPGSRIKRKG